MARISKRKLDPQLEERCFTIFWQHVADLKTPHLTREFLQSLLSYPEQLMLAKRLAIAVLLYRGYTYSQIDRTLKVSKATVASVHKQIMLDSSGYKKAARMILERRQADAVWDGLEEILLKLSLPKAYGSAKWQAKHEQGKNLAKRKRQRQTL